jgi:hypothetical protein
VTAQGAGKAQGDAVKQPPKALAFYQPGFHPTVENDEWHGPGFTEWTLVNGAQPLYPGHLQPHVPADLGYYDLRLPEVRQAQAELASSHGIYGFVYYHYWFHGTRLLERPFDEVLASGSPDFPFALCWANQQWTDREGGGSGRLLMPQAFSDADDLAHIRWLATAFADDRYITIDGRPLMLIHRAQQLPDPKRTFDLWREEAQKVGLPDLYLCWVESQGPPPGGPVAFGLDASVGFLPFTDEHAPGPFERDRGHRVLDYRSVATAASAEPGVPWKRFPSVMVGWDDTARGPHGATVVEGATPEAYEQWLRRTVDSVRDVPDEENYLFITAWNQWADGSHLEPDRRHGRAFLEATRAVLLGTPPEVQDDPAGGEPVGGTGPAETDRATTHAHRLVRALAPEPGSTVVSLVAESEAGTPGPDRAGASAGRTILRCDLSDPDAVQSALDELEHVGVLLIHEDIGALVEPQRLLAALAAWSLKHHETPLVVSAANVAHFDVGLGLLAGRWHPTHSGRPGRDPLRSLTRERLQRLLERCGWRVVARDDVESVRSQQYDSDLNGLLPIELLGALRTMADSLNPSNAVERFVWALTPFPVANPPASFLEAVAPGQDDQSTVPVGDPEEDIRRYLHGVGLLASEQSRRQADEIRRRHADEERRRADQERQRRLDDAVMAASVPEALRSDHLPLWKQWALDAVYHSPRTSAAFQRLYRRLR